MLNNFLFIEIVFLTVLCTQFSAVTGNELTTNEVEVFGNGNGMLKHFAYGLAVVSAKIADGIMIGRQLLHEPHHFYIDMALFFQGPGRTDTVEVSVNKKFQ